MAVEFTVMRPYDCVRYIAVLTGVILNGSLDVNIEQQPVKIVQSSYNRKYFKPAFDYIGRVRDHIIDCNRHYKMSANKLHWLVINTASFRVDTANDTFHNGRSPISIRVYLAHDGHKTEVVPNMARKQCT